jgi:excisionase family DNA binding protein
MDSRYVKRTTYKTPPEVAKELRVKDAKVLSWIRQGLLRAINVAEGTTGRPRWRIAPSDLEAFLATRTGQPAPKVPRKRVKHEGVIEFF